MNNFNYQPGSPQEDDIPFPLDYQNTSYMSAGSTSLPGQGGSNLPFDVPLDWISGDNRPPLGGPVPMPSIPPPGSPLMEPIIIAEQLYKEGTVGLKEVSFKLYKGKLTCIMGGDEHGAFGLLHVLALEDVVISGQLIMHNQDVRQLSSEERDRWRNTHIAYIHQGQFEPSTQTAHMHIAYWLHYYEDLNWNDAKETARQALQRAKVNRSDVPIRELSKDELARVSVAKGHAHSRRNRSIFLFDDVFTLLDPQTMGELVQLLREVAKRGRAVVVLADRQDYSSYFDQVLVMQNEHLIGVYHHT